MKARGSVLLLVVLSIVVFSCRKSGCTDPEADNYDDKAKKDDGSCEYSPKAGTIEFQFDHEVDGTVLTFDDKRFTNKAGNSYSVSTLVYYISEITLYGDDGKSHKIDGFHYRDGRDAGTREYTVKDVPAGKYTSLSFVFGLNEDRNKSGNLPNTAVHNNMIWPDPMGGGYHYMKFEGKFTDTTSSSQEASYNLHTGKLHNTHNFFKVDLSGFTIDMDNDLYEVHLVMNMNKWFENPNTIDLYGGWQAIMGDQDKQTIVKENGKDVFMLHHVSKLHTSH